MLLDPSHDPCYCRKIDTEDCEPVVAIGECRTSIISHNFSTPTVKSTF